MMKKYAKPSLTLLSLTHEDILNFSGESVLTLGEDNSAEEIFGGFTPYR